MSDGHEIIGFAANSDEFIGNTPDGIEIVGRGTLRFTEGGSGVAEGQLRTGPESWLGRDVTIEFNTETATLKLN